jgi:hypothetical protein
LAMNNDPNHNSDTVSGAGEESDQPSESEVREGVLQLFASGKTPNETLDELIAAGVEPSLARSTIESVLAQGVQPAPSPQASGLPQQEIPMEAVRLSEIASQHRQMTLSLLVVIVASVLSRIEMDPILKIIVDLVIVAGAFGYFLGVFLLSQTLRGTAQAILMALVGMVPCLGLIIVARLDEAVKKEFRSSGIQIGLLGVSSTEVLDRLKR